MTDSVNANSSASLAHSSAPMQLNCPTCKKIIFWTEAFPERPFCSDRCRLIDLGDWASESNRIAGSSLDINSEENYD